MLPSPISKLQRMMLLDVLLRERGGSNSRVPRWLIRAVGALLAISGVWLADALGVWLVVGVTGWILHLMALGIGALVAPTALGGLLWLLNGLLVTALMLVMYTPIVSPLVAPFVRRDAVSAIPTDAVIVLSGGLTDDGRVSEQALDRLLSAAEVLRQREIVGLGLSVVTQGRSAHMVTSEQDQRRLVALLAPDVTPQFVYQVNSSRDEAVAFAALAVRQGWRRVVLVTSPMHSRRACMTLEHAGLSVECRPAEGRDYSVDRMVTGRNRRLAFRDVMYESAATLLYRSRGWM